MSTVTSRPLALAGSLSLLVLCTGCPVYQVNSLPDSPPLAQPAVVSASGTYIHEPSGFAFPERVEDFERVQMTRYDTQGLDVSGGYNRYVASCPIVVTVYVYPAPRMQFIGADPDVVSSLESQLLDNEYTKVSTDIETMHPTARLKSGGAIEGSGSPGKRSVFEIDDKTSELELFLVERTWFVQHRHTFPTSCLPEARTALERFHAELRGIGQNAERD